jgi:hypothetical protein
MNEDWDTIEVTCTDNDNVASGTILDWRGDTVRVNLNGLVLYFKKATGTIYATNISGMEFTIDMKGR